jgi:hypothetical protein
METPVKIIVNCETGQVQEIALTPEEIAQREADAIEAARERAEREAAEQALAELKASAKAKLIAGQPLSAEEADILIL